MPEYIHKQAVLNLIDDFELSNAIASNYDNVHELQKLYDAVETMPPADVVEVVRCKDCRFRHKRESTAIGTYYVCVLDVSQMPDPDYFCAHGENCRENQNAKTHGCNMSSSPDAFLCSECGRTLEDPFEGIYVDGVFIGSRQISPNYCPYCGARMDGEEE